MTILLVDDDADDVEMFKHAIRKIALNVTVLTCSDGVECLKLLETILPDIIFLDINMPLMNGHDCLAEIRKDPLLADLNVVIYSTSLSPEDIATSESLNARHLTKFVDYNEFISSLKNILEE